MIVDVHTHFLRYETDMLPVLRGDMTRVGMNPEQWRFTESDYLEATRAADRVIVFGLRAKKTGWAGDNGYVADFVRRHPEKYTYFASVDPGESDVMEQLEFEVGANNARGVKVGPVYQGFHPLDPVYDPIYGYCEAHGLPLMTHMATTFSSGVPLDYARPIHMDTVACRYPGLKIIIAHIGHPWSDEALAVIRKQPNCYADISALYYRPWQFYQTMRIAAEYGCGDKLFFGSDYPATTTGSSIDGLRGVNGILGNSGLPPVPENMIEDILFRDAMKVLFD